MRKKSYMRRVILKLGQWFLPVWPHAYTSITLAFTINQKLEFYTYSHKPIQTNRCCVPDMDFLSQSIRVLDIGASVVCRHTQAVGLTFQAMVQQADCYSYSLKQDHSAIPSDKIQMLHIKIMTMFFNISLRWKT